MKRILILAVLILSCTALMAQKETKKKDPGLRLTGSIADVRNVDVSYINVNNQIDYYLHIWSTSEYDDAYSVFLGDSLQTAINTIAFLQSFIDESRVGQILPISLNKSDYVNKEFWYHIIMAGNANFSGVGKIYERGQTVVFITEKERHGYKFGTYGVTWNTLNRIKKKLKRIQKIYELP